MVSLINRFPREIARPFKEGLVWDMDDINKYIMKYGHSYGIHISIYSFSTVSKDKPDYESAIIDKIYLDIDPPNWLIQVRKVFNWCDENDILSIYVMSGGGSHIYMFCKETVKYKRSCVYNFQSYLEDILDIKIDAQVKGDLSRTLRVPETFNFKRSRYCMYLDKDLIFNHTEEEIYKLAEIYPLYRPKEIVYGNKLLDLESFDKEEFIYSSRAVINVNVDNDLLGNDELKKLNIPFEKFPPCVRSWLNNEDLRHMGRFELVLYLRDQLVTKLPIPFKVIVSILKSFLSNHRWLHCSTDLRLPGCSEGERLKPIIYAFSNRNYKMYSCYQLRDLGLCPASCGRWHPIFE